MATYAKMKLSGSTDGKQIKITQTTSTGNTIHTAVSGTSDYDEVWLYVNNTANYAVNVWIQWGGTTSPDNDILFAVSAQSGLALAVPGLVLHNGNTIYAYADTANVVMVSGFVNRITA